MSSPAAARRTRPLWPLWLVEGATYLAQGLIWRAVVRAAGLRLSVGTAYRLSLVIEAASVFTLHSAGLAVPVALSATLLFRALSFWLPMAPGAWLARGIMREGTALPGMGRA